MRLVAKDGKILETNLNKEQYVKFEAAIYWYQKASTKISRRYAKGVSKGKEFLYSKSIALAIEESDRVEEFYKKYLDGECKAEEFKESIATWFFKVKEGFDRDDKEFKKTKEMF